MIHSPPFRHRTFYSLGNVEALTKLILAAAQKDEKTLE